VPQLLQEKQPLQDKRPARRKQVFHVNHEMENFIGTNVISKIGILITIIGVFIGAKYAIDNELISPLLRIVAGYLAAAILVFTAYRLKQKYEYFSSILIGGGLAVTYFITYIAYSFYGLYPLAIAFALMIITTAVAVGMSLWYNQKVIALLGQVAAYAIPFLLSNGDGNIFILFSYITVINSGLLLLSFKKDWKLLYHIAFFLTWVIYLFSIVVADKVSSFSGGLIFLFINFATFYITFLSYKIFKKQLYQLGEIAILLCNALFFFFLGAYLVNQQFNNVHFLTWFTIANAGIHLAAGYAIYRMRLVDNSVFQFIIGLGLLFITVAIPIELDGSWVTVLWTIEATALFFVAKNTGRELYVEIALRLIVISFISLLHDWSVNYPLFFGSGGSSPIINKAPFLNINFIISLFVCACLSFMSFSMGSFKKLSKPVTANFFYYVLPVAFLAILYFTLFNEIQFAWSVSADVQANTTGLLYQSITLIIFSCLYVAAWFIVNARFIKREKLHYLLIVLGLVANVVFITNGLFIIGELREEYLHPGDNRPAALLITRYYSFAGVAILWLSAIYACKVFKPAGVLAKSISTVFNITLLTIISNEFIHWMDLSGYQNQYKLGLSLICGGYALALLFVGMIKNKKHHRISAIVLFAATLLKLFFYDLASLTTISKTIVLVLLGVLLLVASFLYNKYKNLLLGNEEAGGLYSRDE
jgi:uncharacterized membrane protein